MGTRADALIQKLNDERAYLDEVIAQVDDWDMQVYEDGLAWTAREVMIHVAEADRGHAHQAMNIAVGKEVIPEDFDIQRYNQRSTEKNAEKSAEQAITEMRESRAKLIDWLTGLDDAVLDKEGRHASLQILSVEKIVKWCAIHERQHAQALAAALESNS